MCFGLNNLSRSFQRMMDIVLSRFQGSKAFVHLDNCVISAKVHKEHGLKFDAVMSRFRDANLKVQIQKCRFLSREVTYLGHIIYDKGAQPNPEKVQAVKNFPQPRTMRNLQQFLGMENYYLKFIDHFATVAKPLSSLLKKKHVKF